MEEKKLTAEEIVKKLNYIKEQYLSYIYNDDDECKVLFVDDILDLINRLQTENAEQKKELARLKKFELYRIDEMKKQKAEIERLTSLYDGKHGIMTSSIGDLPLTVEGLRTAVDEISRLLIVQTELQELNAKYYNETKDLRRKLNNDGAIYSRLELDGFVDKARKETAEKFAERLKEKLNEWLEDNEDDDGKIDFGIAEIELIGVKSLDGEIIAESFIDEIAKEFTGGKE